jgi:hypothetical protein
MTIRVDFVRGTKLKINQYRDLLSSRAFSDLLKKHGRPTDLKTALRESVKKEGSKGPISKKRPPRT